MHSIRFRLLAGLALSGLIGTIVLIFAVIQQYGVLSANAPSPYQTFHEIFDHVLLPVGLFLSLFGVGAFLVVRDLEKSLQAIAAKVRQAAESMQAYQAPVDKLPLEVRAYVSAVNELITRLSKHAARQEAFAVDAAHELKTSLALIALELDKFDDGATINLKSHLSGLSDMIDQLLLLARSSVAEISTGGASVDPALIGRRIVEDMAPAAIKAGRQLSFEINDPTPFHGLEEAVSAAVRTLVSNALRATPEGSQVCVVAGPGPQIAVMDEGPGLDAARLDMLKARGVRADTAPGGFAGLGLAIADRIAESHGGDLQTCFPKQTGLALVFPRAAPSGPA